MLSGSVAPKGAIHEMLTPVYAEASDCYPRHKHPFGF